MERKYSALIFGSTGALGRQLVKCLLNSPKWQKIHCVVRKQLEQWMTMNNHSKIMIQKEQNMDKLSDVNYWKFINFDIVFCCLGSQVKNGQQMFVKVDKTYPLNIADIAIANKIPHYLFVSSKGADSTSWFLYPRTKGQAEKQLMAKKLKKLSILRPGVIQNRNQARFGEKVLSFIPFIPKIQVAQLARSLMIIAEKQISNPSQIQCKGYQNCDILKLLANQKNQKNKKK